MTLKTPYYLIHEKKLLNNLKKIEYLHKNSGTRVLLALKCFSAWAVFGLMRKYMHGTTSSSLYEARLGHEKFGRETHAYCVAYSKDEIKSVASFADKIIFNSLAQFKRFYPYVRHADLGIRLNPGVSYSHFDLADPNRKFSRLGVAGVKGLYEAVSFLNGAMFHFNCENDDFKNFCGHLDYISLRYAKLLEKLKWVSLGGGLYFTKQGYPLDRLCARLKGFSRRFGLQVYLEPGESAVTKAAELVTTVLDVVRNKADIAVVDASAEAHMLDLLVYRLPARIENNRGRFKYIVAGRSCLAGDVFGTFKFNRRLKAGDTIRFNDAAGYTMVKTNWFNGLNMPSIAVKRLNGRIDVVKRFEYKDFVNSLS